jgi:chromosome partitioning protein
MAKAVKKNTGPSALVMMLAEARKRLGIRVTNAALDPYGLTANTVSEVETGKRTPTEDTLNLMGKMVGLRITTEPATPAKVLALYNHAGGATKSSLAREVAYAMVQTGKRVCLVDCDPQANVSSWLGLEAVQEHETILPVVVGRGEPSLPTMREAFGIQVIPSQLEVVGIDEAGLNGRSHRLRQALHSAQDIDLFVLDLPPTISPITSIALRAATHLLIPMPTKPKSLEALKGIQRVLQTRRIEFSAEPIEIVGYVLTRFHSGYQVDEAVAAEIRANFGDLVLGPISERQVWEKAALAGQPVGFFDPQSPAVEEIATLVGALIASLYGGQR